MTVPPFPNSLTLPVIVLFLFVISVAVLAVELETRRKTKEEIRSRAYDALHRKAMLRKQKEAEAFNQDLLDKVERYRNDIDEPGQAG